MHGPARFSRASVQLNSGKREPCRYGLTVLHAMDPICGLRQKISAKYVDLSAGAPFSLL